MSQEPRVYVARAGRAAGDEDSALENNVAIVGFQNVPSLADAGDYDGVQRIVSNALLDTKPRGVVTMPVNLRRSLLQ